MTESRRPRDFVYVHSDIPPGMTIREWRGARRTGRHRTGRGAWPAASLCVRLSPPRGARWRAPSAGQGSRAFARVAAGIGRRAEVERRVASLRRIAEQLRAASR